MRSHRSRSFATATTLHPRQMGRQVLAASQAVEAADADTATVRVAKPAKATSVGWPTSSAPRPALAGPTCP